MLHRQIFQGVQRESGSEIFVGDFAQGVDNSPEI